MKAQYKRDMNRNYLMLPLESDSYETEMICQNEIDGMLGAKRKLIEGETWLCYDISSRQNLSRVYERKDMDFGDVKALFYSWERVVNQAERFLLSPGFFVCNPDYLYYNLSEKRPEWIFYPRKEGMDFPKDLNLLSEFMLEKVDHKDADAVDVVYKFYHNVKEDCFLLSEMIDLIETVKVRTGEEEKCEEHDEFVREGFRMEEEIKPILPKDVSSFDPLYNEPAAEGILKKVGKFFSGLGGRKETEEKGKLHQKDIKKGKLEKEEDNPGREYPSYPENDGNGDMGNVWYAPSVTENEISNETVLIGRKDGGKRELTCIKNGRKYSLKNLPVIVGKLKEGVDICLEDPSVSRMHAKFYEDNGEIWMEDLNSTNGCEQNEMKLEANEKVKLCPGDRIRIGEMDFIYN